MKRKIDRNGCSVKCLCHASAVNLPPGDGATTLTIATLSITTLSITLKKRDTQHNDTQNLALNTVMLSVI